MPRTSASYALLCLISVGLLGNPVIAQSAQQPVTESVKVSAQKTKTASTKPVAVKAVAASSKATAKVADKPGKRFWSRIMSCFRDVHSVEKKTNK